MTEENTQPIEEPPQPIEEVTPLEPQLATKSKKSRSDLQKQALEKARQKSYKIRAEQAAIKKESKKTAHVSFELPIELPESHQEITEEIHEDLNENISEPNKEVKEGSLIEQIERHAERQEFNDHINNLIDERVQYKPVVKSKYKLINEVYVLR